jgi:hypothetical protein
MSQLIRPNDLYISTIICFLINSATSSQTSQCPLTSRRDAKKCMSFFFFFWVGSKWKPLCSRKVVFVSAVVSVIYVCTAWEGIVGVKVI